MILNIKRCTTLFVMVFVAFTAVSASVNVANSKNVSIKTDSLTQGIFLHTHGNSIDPVIQNIVEGKKLQASSGKEVKFQNGKTEVWTTHTADSTGWFKGDYLGRGYGLFTIT